MATTSQAAPARDVSAQAHIPQHKETLFYLAELELVQQPAVALLSVRAGQLRVKCREGKGPGRGQAPDRGLQAPRGDLRDINKHLKVCRLRDQRLARCPYLASRFARQRDHQPLSPVRQLRRLQYA